MGRHPIAGGRAGDTADRVFVASVGFACYGLAATSLARGYEFFSYFFTFWITPMFVFCGVFFDINRFPQWCRPYPGCCR